MTPEIWAKKMRDVAARRAKLLALSPAEREAAFRNPYWEGERPRLAEWSPEIAAEFQHGFLERHGHLPTERINRSEFGNPYYLSVGSVRDALWRCRAGHAWREATKDRFTKDGVPIPCRRCEEVAK